MTQWTDKHYDFTYTLSEKDIEQGGIKIDPYFISKQWKVGSKDDSGALFHCLKTIARFGHKNDIEREVKALHAQVLGVARSFGVELDIVQTQTSLWYPDNSGEWIEYDGSGQPVEEDVVVEVLLDDERYDQCWKPMAVKANEWHWGINTGNAEIVAYKVVK